MKKIYCTIVLLIIALSLGCGEDTPTKEKKDEVTQPILDYYPANVGSRWTYQNAEGKTFTRTIKESGKFDGVTYKMWQVEPSNPETKPQLFRKTKTGIRLYSKKMNESIMTFVKESFKPLQGWALFNFTVKSAVPEGLLVQLPLEPGLDWLVMHVRASGTLAGGKRMTLTLRFTGHSSRKEIIAVPAGTFECIRVTYKYKGDLEIAGEAPDSYTETMYSHWFAPDVGIVQIEDASGIFQLIDYDLML